MSETNFPPRGTKCNDCGCCDAAVYAAGIPVCWECDECVPCKGKQRAAAAAQPATKEIPPAVEEPEPVTLFTVHDGEVTVQTISREEAMPRGKYAREGAVPCASEGCEHFAYPPKKYCSKKHFYLNKAGAKAPARVPAAPRRSTIERAPVPRAIVHHAPKPAAVASGHTINITTEISPAGVEKFWSVLSMEQKVQIVAASIHSILNPAQEG